MQKRGYGRIKRTKSLYKAKKSRFRRVLESVGFAMLLIALVFVGYTIADAIRNYTPSEEVHVNNPEPDEIPGGDSHTVTTPEVSDTTEPPLLSSDAVYAGANAFMSAQELQAQLTAAKAGGFGAVIIEMKDDTGRLLYQSRIEAVLAASNSGEIIAGGLSAEEIVQICAAAEITPIARVNTLKDHIVPTSWGAAYASWLDNSVENDGKRWLNPFAQATIDYTSAIIAELEQAGFADIILANTVYPFEEFRSIDRSILPSNVTNSDTRHTGLGEFVNTVADSSGARLFAEVLVSCFSGDNIRGTAEVLRNKPLNISGVKLVFTRGDLESAEGASVTEMLESLLSAVKNYTGELEISPVLYSENLSESDHAAVLAAFEAKGFEQMTIFN
jgi:hypothetical protein